MTLWIIDGNNVFGSRPDGWWNDRTRAAQRLTQQIAEWCRTHADDVVVVFDPPLDESVVQLGGGNLAVVEAPRRGRNAADDHIVELARGAHQDDAVTVVSSDRGLISRLPPGVRTIGARTFLDITGPVVP